MAKKDQESDSSEKFSFIRQVSTLHGDRLHVEVPAENRKEIKQGDYVKVKKIKP